MPYQTTYTLTQPQDEPDIERIAAKLSEIADEIPPGDPEYDGNIQLWQDVLEGLEPTQWTEMEKHMAKVSEHWPGVLFIIESKGETTEDLWRIYAKDGMHQAVRAEVTYPDHDPEQMKRP